MRLLKLEDIILLNEHGVWDSCRHKEYIAFEEICGFGYLSDKDKTIIRLKNGSSLYVNGDISARLTKLFVQTYRTPVSELG